MNWIYVLLVSVVVLFLLAFLLSGRDILAPSVVMCAMFVLSATMAILGTDRLGISLGEKTCVILIAGILTFILTETIFQHIFQRDVTIGEKCRQKARARGRSFGAVGIQGWIIILGILLDLFVIAWYVKNMIAVAGGIGGTYREVAVQNTVKSWDTTLINPLLGQLLKLTKVMGYIAGFVFIQHLLAREKGCFQAIGLIALMALSQAPSLLAGERGGILQFIAALLVYYYVLLHQKNGWHKNLSWKFIRIGIFCVVIGAPLFYYSLKWIGRGTLESLFDYAIKYVGYPIYSFDLYLEDPVPPVAFGEESLGGLRSFISRVLGVDIYVRNTNLEFRYQNEIKMPNVYTFFRRPLHDFGFGGMLIFTILVSCLFSWIYYSKIKWRHRSKKTDCWILAYGYLFHWVAFASIMQYSESLLSVNTIIIMLAMVFGYRLMTGIKATQGKIQYYRRYWGSVPGVSSLATRQVR